MCADINKDSAAATVAKITSTFGEGHAVSIQADVSKEDQVKAMIDLAVNTFGRRWYFFFVKEEKEEHVFFFRCVN